LHLGICLRYYGLIRPQSRAHCHLVSTVTKYVSSRFKKSAQNLFYYLHIVDYEEALTEFLSEPNVPLRASIAGKVSPDHIVVSEGLLYKFCGMDRFLAICKTSAQKAYDNGEIEHCILLNVLCGDLQKSALICIKLLCSHITDKPDNPSKRFIAKMAKDIFNFNKRLERDQQFHELSTINPAVVAHIDNRTSANLVIAILFSDFYDSYNAADHAKALDMITRSDLIPLRDELIISLSNQSRRHELIKRFQDSTMKIDPNLQKFVGNICVAVMEMLSTQFQACRMRQQQKEAQMISAKCEVIYNYFNRMESTIKPTGTGDDTAQNISKFYYSTRLH